MVVVGRTVGAIGCISQPPAFRRKADHEVAFVPGEKSNFGGRGPAQAMATSTSSSCDVDVGDASSALSSSQQRSRALTKLSSTADYVIKGTYTVDTRDFEDHTFSGIIIII